MLKALLHVALLFFTLPVVSAQHDWKLTKEEKGIKVYLRDHPGRGIKEFKALVTFNNVTVDYFYKLFKDGNRAIEWSYAVKHAQVLESPSATEDIIYYQMDTPWPLQERDVVQKQHIVWHDHDKTVVCTSFSLPNHLPKKKGFTRVEESSVTWVFKQISPTQVAIHYELFTDPKVPVPDGLVQYFITNGPIFVLDKLRDYVNKNPQLYK